MRASPPVNAFHMWDWCSYISSFSRKARPKILPLLLPMTAEDEHMDGFTLPKGFRERRVWDAKEFTSASIH